MTFVKMRGRGFLGFTFALSLLLVLTSLSLLLRKNLGGARHRGVDPVYHLLGHGHPETRFPVPFRQSRPLQHAGSSRLQLAERHFVHVGAAEQGVRGNEFLVAPLFRSLAQFGLDLPGEPSGTISTHFNPILANINAFEPILGRASYTSYLVYYRNYRAGSLGAPCELCSFDDFYEHR